MIPEKLKTEFISGDYTNIGDILHLLKGSLRKTKKGNIFNDDIFQDTLLKIIEKKRYSNYPNMNFITYFCRVYEKTQLDKISAEKTIRRAENNYQRPINTEPQQVRDLSQFVPTRHKQHYLDWIGGIDHLERAKKHKIQPRQAWNIQIKITHALRKKIKNPDDIYQ